MAARSSGCVAHGLVGQIRRITRNKDQKMKARMNQTMKRAIAVVLLACLGATLAFAQLDGGTNMIVQNGVQVGEIYVPPHGSQGLYAEHWILYPNYIYPNATNGVKTEIVPISNDDPKNPNYTSEADFFARAEFGAGYRYVHVTSNDSTRFPRP